MKNGITIPVWLASLLATALVAFTIKDRGEISDRLTKLENHMSALAVKVDMLQPHLSKNEH